MKKRLQGLVAGILAGTMIVLGIPALASSVSKTAEIFYNNIKIYVDGAEIVPKDANGNIVEPFIMNGTTYLPIRAVASAFGKEVEWDGKTQSAYLGKKDETKPDNYLDKIQYNDYKEGGQYNNFSIIKGTVTDFDKNVYTSGLIFWVDRAKYYVNDGAVGPNIMISYPLNSQYASLKGKIVLPTEYNINASDMGHRSGIGVSPSTVWFLGDGKELYKATNVTSSMPFSFDIDVEGVNQLVIKIKTEKDNSHVALTDLALYK